MVGRRASKEKAMRVKKSWWQRVIYFIVEKLVAIGVNTYFSSVKVHGRSDVPRSGPLIIVGNHPNMILDPVLIAYTSGRSDGHFWAMAPLFKGFGGWLISALGAVPVQRRDDNQGQSVEAANAKLFEGSYAVLKEAESMFIFPEGKSYTEPHLQPFKTGTIRLALGFLKETKGMTSVPIIPCGLNYINKHKFRSEVFVQFGKPLRLPMEMASVDMDTPEGRDSVRHYTQVLEQQLQSLTINAPDWETMRLLKLSRRIYQDNHKMSLEDHVELSRRFSRVYCEHAETDEQIQNVNKQLKEYQDRLESLHLKDHYISADLSKRNMFKMIVGRFFFLVMVFALAAPGAVLHFPIYAIAKLLERTTPYVESRTMIKFCISIFITAPLTYLVVLTTVLALWGLKAFLCAMVILPLFTLAHIYLVESGIVLSRSFVPLIRLFFLMVLGFKEVVKQLTEQRASLKEQIEALVVKYYPPSDAPRDTWSWSNDSPRKSRFGVDHDTKYV